MDDEQRIKIEGMNRAFIELDLWHSGRKVQMTLNAAYDLKKMWQPRLNKRQIQEILDFLKKTDFDWVRDEMRIYESGDNSVDLTVYKKDDQISQPDEEKTRLSRWSRKDKEDMDYGCSFCLLYCNGGAQGFFDREQTQRLIEALETILAQMKD